MDANLNAAIVESGNDIYSTNTKAANTRAANAKKNAEAEKKTSETAKAGDDVAATVEISNKKAAKNGFAPVDPAAVQKALDAAKTQNEQFVEMIRKLATRQGQEFAIADFDITKQTNLADFFSNLKPTQEEVSQAKELISEDGYYGVKAVTGRILDFAKAVAGDDPDKIAKMKDAVEKGFDMAKRAWGKELPSITKETYKSVMDGFDEWEKAAQAKAAGTPAA